MENITLDSMSQLAIAWLIKIAFAVVIFIIGKWIAKRLTAFARKLMQRGDVDPTLVSFGGNMIYALLITFVIIASLSQLGVQTASLIAVLGAAGLAIGLALQGSLSNFAAGVMIIAFRPFTKGDFIDAGGVSGTVSDVNIFTTTLLTPDNKKVITPNAQITDGTITNFSAMPTRRIDMIFGIGYEDDIPKAKKLLEKLVDADERILKDPAPVIAVHALADSSVNLVCRPWVKREDYWAVHFAMHEQVKIEFDKANISIPFPQRDVHVHNVPANDGTTKPTPAKATATKPRPAKTPAKKVAAPKKATAAKKS